MRKYFLSCWVAKVLTTRKWQSWALGQSRLAGLQAPLTAGSMTTSLIWNRALPPALNNLLSTALQAARAGRVCCQVRSNIFVILRQSPQWPGTHLWNRCSGILHFYQIKRKMWILFWYFLIVLIIKYDPLRRDLNVFESLMIGCGASRVILKWME